MTLPVDPKCLALGLAEKAPGARMLLSWAENEFRRLLVDTLFARVLLKLPRFPKVLPLNVPGVLAVLEALAGEPNVLYVKP